MTPFIYETQVPFHHVDAAGKLFFAHLFTHAHQAYAAFMKTNGYDLKTILLGDYRIPIVHAQADFHAPIHFDDPLHIHIQTGHVGTRSFCLHYRFLVSQRHCASARTCHAWLEAKTQRATALPQKLKAKLKCYSLSAESSPGFSNASSFCS